MKTKTHTAGSLPRMVRRLERSLKTAIAIIRNCAVGLEITGLASGAERLYRFANELETESGLRKRKTPNAKLRDAGESGVEQH